MKIYNYNKDTKEFISQTEASANPLEKDKYLIPANATAIEVQVVKDGFVGVFDEVNQKWDYVEDNRGTTIYDINTKQEYKVDYLGAVKDGFTKLVPSKFDVWNGSSWEVDLVAQATAQALAINNAIQNHLDTTAQSLRYDNINAIGKYVGYDNDFRTEAEALGAWASSCWKVAGEIEADVKAGNREMPTVDEVLEELPEYDDGGE